MSDTTRAQTELEQILTEIGRLDQQLAKLRERAAKVADYLEIAREYEGNPRAGYPETEPRRRRSRRKRSTSSNGENIIELPPAKGDPR